MLFSEAKDIKAFITIKQSENIYTSNEVKFIRGCGVISKNFMHKSAYSHKFSNVTTEFKNSFFYKKKWTKISTVKYDRLLSFTSTL